MLVFRKMTEDFLVSDEQLDVHVYGGYRQTPCTRAYTNDGSAGAVIVASFDNYSRRSVNRIKARLRARYLTGA